MILVRFQGKPFNITVSKSMPQPLNAKEAEAAWYYEDLLELTPKKKNNVLFITGDWNAKTESQETPEVIGQTCLEVQNEAGQRLTEFC